MTDSKFDAKAWVANMNALTKQKHHKMCKSCKTKPVKFKCSGPNCEALYCEKECQMKDWKTHALICGKDDKDKEELSPVVKKRVKPSSKKKKKKSAVTKKSKKSGELWDPPPESANDKAVNQALYVLRGQWDWVKEIIKEVTVRDIRAWARTSRAFYMYIVKNPRFWFLILQTKYPAILRVNNMGRQYNSTFDMKYIRLGVREFTLSSSGLPYIILNTLTKNEAGMDELLRGNFYKDDLINLSLTNRVFHKHLMDNNLFWYHVNRVYYNETNPYNFNRNYRGNISFNWKFTLRVSFDVDIDDSIERPVIQLENETIEDAARRVFNEIMNELPEDSVHLTERVMSVGDFEGVPGDPYIDMEGNLPEWDYVPEFDETGLIYRVMLHYEPLEVHISLNRPQTFDIWTGSMEFYLDHADSEDFSGLFPDVWNYYDGSIVVDVDNYEFQVTITSPYDSEPDQLLIENIGTNPMPQIIEHLRETMPDGPATEGCSVVVDIVKRNEE